ncbi:DUF4349 domain-containing protein [Ilumatobacter sp.]|uniref:DUF4349 domain-containing protein n=1 Tax=Ilumatobacter sp. TaxID=1967498 RepID=UPI003B52BBE9
MGRHTTTGTAGTPTRPPATDAAASPGRLGTRTGPSRRRRSLGAAALGVALVAGACANDDDATTESDAVDVAASREDTVEAGRAVPAATEAVNEAGDASTAEVADVADDGDVSEDASEESAAAGGAAAGPGADGGAAFPLPDFGRDVIREVGLTIATSDVADASSQVRRIVARDGGAVFASDVEIGSPAEDGSVPGGGRIVVRIPPADLERLVDDLHGAGTVTRLTQDSEDVTDQLVDLDIRIRQAEIGIERIEDLLTRAVELDVVFALETELTNRQVELERLRAARRTTDDRVALATLTVEIRYLAPELAAPAPIDARSDDGLADAFADGWGAFVGVAFSIGLVLAVTAPFLAVLLCVGALAWLIGRALSRRRHAEAERARLAADRAGAEVTTAPAAESVGDVEQREHA